MFSTLYRKCFWVSVDQLDKLRSGQLDQLDKLSSNSAQVGPEDTAMYSLDYYKISLGHKINKITQLFY